MACRLEKVHPERSGRRAGRWSFRGQCPGTLAIAVVMFVIAAIALAVNLSWQRESFGWVEHTNEVLRNISALEKAVFEAESGRARLSVDGREQLS